MSSAWRAGALLLACFLLFAGGGALAWWGLAPRIALEAQRADQAEVAAGDAQEMVDMQGRVLAEQQRQIGAVDEIHKRMRLLEQAVTANARAQSVAFKELTRNDQAVAEYLRGSVPTGLGRLYERPGTTDPGAYRSPAVLPAGGVSAAGKTSGADQ